ncbi:MAG: hypothetical protein FWF60_01975 [Oscillospiraceae bacterium]|nr:hypothetical protein [Oscillospiraceae bacterium]
MNILYLITKYFTCPGAFLKGFWEHVTCRVLKLQVTDRRYLRANERCGHAAHAPAMSPARAFLLSFLPYLPQRILGWIFVGASAAPLLLFHMHSLERNPLLPFEAVALFLGLSLLCSSFPQWEDAKRQWQLFYGAPEAEPEVEPEVEAEPETPPAGLAAKIILAPCNAYFLVGAWLERHGIPVILAIAITVAALVLG